METSKKTAITFLAGLCSLLSTGWAKTPLHKLDWQRQDQPILSGMTTDQSWCRVLLYSPTVIRVNGTYKMWYLGNSTYVNDATDMALGYAESKDGLNWTEYPDNPILTNKDLPFGNALTTPHVMFDEDEQIYKMWFISMTARLTEEKKAVVSRCQLGYATSKDCIKWDMHPEPLLDDGRRPYVLKDGPHSYQMWMNSRPTPDGSSKDLCRNIYRFESADGLQWKRDDKPVVSTQKMQLIVYPSVLKDESGYTLWYGRSRRETIGHDHGVPFELYCSTSTDGIRWTHHHEKAALAATKNPDDFDGRYVSTPCVLDDGDRYLMYYSARDLGNLYRAGDGKLLSDSLYRHIGVAICPK
jgi:hypothetical protein